MSGICFTLVPYPLETTGTGPGGSGRRSQLPGGRRSPGCGAEPRVRARVARHALKSTRGVYL